MGITHSVRAQIAELPDQIRGVYYADYSSCYSTHDRPQCSLGPVMARNSKVLDSNSVRVGCLSRGCAYTALQTVQMPGVCGVVNGMYNEEPVKSFNNSRASWLRLGDYFKFF